MSQPYVTVDAFTDEPFAGNPAAVCLLDGPRSDQWLQGVAREMNCAETAFLTRREDGFGLRWFTPTIEVPLCGHATLASAHALWESQVVSRGTPIRFHTLSGLLRADADDVWIRISFPLEPLMALPVTAAEVVLLGETPVAYARNSVLTIAQLADEAAVCAFVPALDRVASLPGMGLAITAASTRAGFDVVSRFFAPRVGIPEDPATGGAHVALASFWSPRLGKTTFMARQASARGGVFRVTLHSDHVEVAGRAVTTLRGTILV